ncbi:hypothetical protein QA612_09785 [Evansella sp. AB-P1]|nr:hypothetical protein [Evansella sp. AB-P1]MDG5787790.1 hypothetical protein [Evansella sp. AB-P1]
MYSVVEGTTTDIFFVYIAVIGACILLSPMFRFIISVISKGLNKWR